MAALPQQFTTKCGEVLKIDIAKPDDLSECFDFSRDYFFRARPLSLILNGQTLETLNFVEPWITRCVESNVSLAVRNEAGQVVAVRMSEVSTRQNPAQMPESAVAHFEFFLGKLGEGIDLFEQYETDKLFHFVLMAVHPRYGNQGLAQKLLQISLELAKNTGAGLVTMEAVNKYALKAGVKNGFYVINSIDFADFEERIPPGNFAELQVENPKAYLLVKLIS